MRVSLCYPNVGVAQAQAFGVAASIDSLRFGAVSTNPTVPQYWLDDFALSDEPTFIGPVVPPPTAAWSMWDGPQELPLTLDGVWDGTTVAPLSYDTVT
jgi:hypothetical protein